jgi:hypothetical protein
MTRCVYNAAEDVEDMEDVDKRRRFFPGYKKTNICENIELLQ